MEFSVIKSNEPEEIRVTNVSANTKGTLRKMARYYGLTLNSFVKQQLKLIIESAPEHVKNYSED